MEEFTKELTDLINKHSLEGESNTPDFVLAAYLVACLMNYNFTVAQKEILANTEIAKATGV